MSTDKSSFPLTEFRTRRRIEFADTDMGGLVHFSRFFVFMETAEHELLNALGATIHMTLEDGRTIGWPRVAASCEYLSAVRLGDEVDIHVRVARKGAKSMTYAMTFSCEGIPVARGRISSVCCVLDSPDGLEAIPIPYFIADKLAEP